MNLLYLVCVCVCVCDCVCLLQANATGRGAKTVKEYLEKNYSPEAVKTTDDTIKLAIKALLEVSTICVVLYTEM